MKRPELLPGGETLEQHAKWAQEEAKLVQLDRDNKDSQAGGLFKGCFKPHLTPNHDPGDNVARCPLCQWEVVDNFCESCGIDFDENVDDSFGGFSDMDGMSEHDRSSEDLDGDFDMEDYDGEVGFDAGYDDDGQYMDDDTFANEHSYAVRRWLAIGGRPPPHGNYPRRRAAHSAAGSRRSYSASLVSGMHPEDANMGILEEEDEEDEDDSSMADFIENDEESEGGSQDTTSTADQTPQPPIRSIQRRNRRVVESESSSASQITEEEEEEDEEEDEDDAPPVAPGRHRLQSRAHMQGRRERQLSPNSVATSNTASLGPDNEEDMQALLLNQGWSPLDHGSNDEDMDEEGEESDGQRTTVGWENITNSNDRSRTGGSLTPTAGRPNPSIRPPTRVRNRYPDGSRGLRPRSSVLSISTSAISYEDGEADDDASDVDRTGGINMSPGTLRTRNSRIRLRPGLSMSSPGRPDNRGLPQLDGADLDGDDSSDSSSRMTGGRRQTRWRQQEYNPRISWMFAQHMTDMRQADTQESNPLYGYLEQLRATTPIGRPRTANRNRPPSRAGNNGPNTTTTNLPGSLGAVLQSPQRNYQAPLSSPQAVPVRSPSRTSAISNRISLANTSGNRQQGMPNRDTASTIENPTLPPSANSSAPLSPHAQHNPSPIQARSENPVHIAPPTTDDLIERPPSRLPSRPPSASGQRASGGYSMPYSTLGLNFAARQFQVQNNNPFIRPRPRQSTQRLREQPSAHRLREQSSTATLRPRSSQRTLRAQPSQTSVREAPLPLQDANSSGVRVRQSRNNLRSMPSQQRLHAQASNRNMRPTGVQAAPHPYLGSHVPSSPSSRHSTASTPSRLTDDERRRRADELVRRRQQELGGTNPFSGARRQNAQNINNNSANLAGFQPGTVSMNTTMPMASSLSATPPSPNLSRRRSARNMSAPPGVFLPTSAALPNGARPRVGSLTNSDMVYGHHPQPMALTTASSGSSVGGRPF